MQLLLAAFIIFISSWLGAIGMFGSNLLATPLLLWAGLNLETVILVLLIIGTVASLHMLTLTWRTVNWWQAGYMLLLAGLGLPVGYFAMELLPQPLLLVMLGLICIISGVLHLFRLQTLKKLFSSPKAKIGLLLAGGVIHGAFACGGAAIVLYAREAFPRKAEFRGTLNAFWIGLNTILALGILWHRPSIPAPAGRLIVVGIPLVIIGNLLGQWVVARTSEERFRDFVAALIVVCGVLIIGKAF